jgi:hypothetical protein
MRFLGHIFPETCSRAERPCLELRLMLSASFRNLSSAPLTRFPVHGPEPSSHRRCTLRCSGFYYAYPDR